MGVSGVSAFLLTIQLRISQGLQVGGLNCRRAFWEVSGGDAQVFRAICKEVGHFLLLGQGCHCSCCQGAQTLFCFLYLQRVYVKSKYCNSSKHMVWWLGAFLILRNVVHRSSQVSRSIEDLLDKMWVSAKKEHLVEYSARLEAATTEVSAGSRLWIWGFFNVPCGCLTLHRGYSVRLQLLFLYYTCQKHSGPKYNFETWVAPKERASVMRLPRMSVYSRSSIFLRTLSLLFVPSHGFHLSCNLFFFWWWLGQDSPYLFSISCYILRARNCCSPELVLVLASWFVYWIAGFGRAQRHPRRSSLPMQVSVPFIVVLINCMCM